MKADGFLGISIAIIFVAIGYYLYFEKASQKDISNPMLVKIVGGVCMLFFGLFALLAIIKMIRAFLNKRQ